MKKQIVFFLAFLTLSAFAAFELFDKEPVQGFLKEGASLVQSGGQDGSGALKLTGTGKVTQYAYSYRWNKVEPGKKYGISFAYRPSPDFKGSVVVMVRFSRGNWQFEGKPATFTVPLMKDRWYHRQVIFPVPAGMTQCEATIRLVNVPATEHLLVDNLRVANVTDDKGFFLARTLDTIFDNWVFLGQQHFEHYTLGSGAEVKMDWKHAKAGESFLEIHGDGSKMQYPLIIRNITVEPDRNYRFSCWYNASKHFDGGVKVFMFECMDANGKHLSQPRVGVKSTKGEWKELVFDFKTPANAALLDIMFNMRLFKEDAVIRFDQMKFENGNVGPDLRQSFEPARKLMNLACPVLGDLGTVTPVKNLYEVRDMKGKVVRNLESPANETLVVKLDDWQDGEYMMHAKVLLSDGRSMECEPRHFGVYKNPYWKNELGILKDGDPAPAPWKNLTRKGDTITAWNGTFQFGKNLELLQFTEGNGTRLLNGPVSIFFGNEPVKAAGNIAWQDGTARMNATVPVIAQGWKGILSMTLDYMGFVRYGLKLTGEGAALSDVSVKYNVRDVEFVHRADASWNNTGAIDLKDKKRWHTSHRYHEIMLGNVDRGIAWYSPKSFPALNDFAHDVTSADVEGNFSVRLVNAPLHLAKGKDTLLEFAVMPWPFRPSAGNWKHLRFRAHQYTNYNVNTSMKPSKYAGMPASKDDKLMMDFATRLHKPGEIGTFYQIPFYITDTMPEYRYFESEWQGFPSRYYVLKAFGKNAKMRKCDMRNRLWQDMYCYMCKEHLAKFPWRGFYYDCYGSDLLVVNGENFHPTFETRLFHERIFLTTNQARPGFHTFTHAGAQQACTSAGFTDVTLMGEQYRAPCMLHDYYLEFLTLDQFRYENAVNIGPDRMFLPQYRQVEKTQSPQICAHAVGLAFLHNNMLYPSFVEPNVCKRMILKLYGFGLENAEFFPYWKPNPHGATTGDATVPISYWKNEKGYLATVLNSTKETKTVKVILPGQAKDATLLEPVSGKETPFNSGDEVTLPPFMPVLIQCGK